MTLISISRSSARAPWARSSARHLARAGHRWPCSRAARAPTHLERARPHHPRAGRVQRPRCTRCATPRRSTRAHAHRRDQDPGHRGGARAAPARRVRRRRSRSRTGRSRTSSCAQAFGAARVLGRARRYERRAAARRGGAVHAQREHPASASSAAATAHAPAVSRATIDASGVRAAATPRILTLEWSKFCGWVGLMALSVTTRARDLEVPARSRRRAGPRAAGARHGRARGRPRHPLERPGDPARGEHCVRSGERRRSQSS